MSDDLQRFDDLAQSIEAKYDKLVAEVARLNKVVATVTAERDEARANVDYLDRQNQAALIPDK